MAKNIKVVPSLGTIQLSGSNANTSISVTDDGQLQFGESSNTGSLNVTGDLVVQGSVTAQEFKTEFVSASIIYRSGSTKFGDTSDDTHSFTGSLEVSGSINNTNIQLDAPNFNLKIGNTSTLSSVVGAGQYNTSIGQDTGANLTTGYNFTGLGYSAGKGYTTGNSNISIGNYTGPYFNTTDGAQNVLIGSTIGIYMTDGASDNVGVGGGSLYYNTSGAFNTAIGRGALQSNESGSYNTTLGGFAAINLKGDNNIAIGYNSMKGVTLGSNNIVIGDLRSGVLGTTLDGVTAIGSGSRIDFYADSTGVGIGTTSPNATLDVQGSKIHLGTGGSNNDRAFFIANTVTNTFEFNNSAGDRGVRIVTNNGSVGGSAASRIYGAAGGILLEGANGQENIALTTDGNVGIGITSPGTKLQVGGAGYFSGETVLSQSLSLDQNYANVGLILDENTYILTKDNTSLRRLIGKIDDIIEIGQPYTSLTDGIKLMPGVSGYVSVYNNDAEAARFQGGNLGLGTTSPATKLDVDGTGRITDTVYLSTNINSKIGIGTTTPLQKLHLKDGTDVNLQVGAVSGELQLKSTNDADSAYIPMILRASEFSLLNGNVGIGTTSPIYQFEVSGSNGSFGVGSTGNDLYFTRAGASYFYATQANSAFGFYTNSNLGLWQNSSGNVGIGTTNPESKLTVDGYVQVPNGRGITFTDIGDGNVNRVAIVGSEDNDTMFFRTDNGVRMAIASTNVGIGTNTPPEKLTVEGNISASGDLTVGGTVTVSGNISTQGALLLDGNDGLYLNQGAASTYSPAPGIFYSGTSGQGWYFQVPNNGQEKFSIKLGSTSATREFRVVDPSWNSLFQVQGTGDAIIANNLTVGGTVTAQEFHTEFVSASIIYQSGSTKFGDTSDDVHSFTGSLQVLGAVNRPFSVTDGRAFHQGESGGWRLEYGFKGSSGTDRGGFGAQGGNDTVTYYYIGSTQTNPTLAATPGGNVGIGTTSPADKLDVAGNIFVQNNGYLRASGSGALYLGNTNGGIFKLSGDQGDSIIETVSNRMIIQTSRNVDDIEFKVGTNAATSSMFIDATNAYVGIGTTSPSKTLTIIGDVLASGTITSNSNIAVGNDLQINGDTLLFTNDTQAAYIKSADTLILDADYDSDDNPGGKPILFRVSGDTKMVVDGRDGNVGIGTTTPSAKLEVSGSVKIDKGHLLIDGATHSRIYLQNPGGSGDNFIAWYDSNASYDWYFGQTAENGGLNMYNYAAGGTHTSFNTDGTTNFSLGNVNITHNLTVGGIVTAQEFHTEFVSASIIYQSGSTKFGDTSDDVHSFTGSLGILSGSLTLGGPTPLFYIKDSTLNTTHQLNSNNTELQIKGDQALELFANNTSSIYIASDGDVGINTDAPSAKLDVVGTSEFNGEVNVISSPLQMTDQYYLRWGSTARIYGSSAANTLIFETAATERMRIAGSNVGIGTTSPTLGRLHLVQDSDSVIDGITVEETSGGNTMRLWMDGSTRKINAGGSNTMIEFDTSKVVFPTGNVGIGPSVNTSLGKLAVSQSAGTQASGFALHGDNGKAYMYMSGSTSKLAIQSGFTGGGSILLNPNGDGNVGIGNTNPTHTVEIGTDGGGEKILKMHSDTASSYFEIQSLGNVARLLATNNTNLLLQSDGTGGYITFNANSAERMRIDSSGRLLLNSTSTSFSDKLYINGDAYVNGAWRVGTSSTYVGKLYNTSGILTLESDSTRDIQFGSVTNGTAMFIEGTNGNVGIGTTSPAKLLTVAGEAQFTGEVFFNGGFDVTSGTVSRFRDDIPLHFGINRVFELVYDSTSDKLEFNSGSNAIMTLDGDGNLVVEGSITATSFTGSFNTTPTSPTNLSLTQEDGTVVVQFTSASGEVHRYEVWSSVGDETNYNLIGALNEDNFTASIQIVDDTFNKNDTIYYTVYSLRNGKYSDSLTGNIAVTGNVADVTGMRVMESLHGYHLEWVLPDDNRLQQVNVKVDSSATLAGLSEANSTTFYSGLAEQTFYEVPEADANKYHQFWIDSVTRT